jgi:two-component system chemotaxis sensor kinase CheA
MDDLLADFLTETAESLGELDVALVRLERAPDDPDTLSLIFRLVHTIKGTCGFLDLARLERVAHATENVLGRLRDGTLLVSPGVISQVLTALDRIKLIVAGLSATRAEPPGDDSALIEALDRTAEGAGPPPDARVRDPVGVDGPSPEQARDTAEPVIGEPAPALLMPADMVAAPQSVRVAVDVLEDLMTLVRELVLTRNQLIQLARTQDNSPFAAPLQRLSHITTDLQEGVMKTRLQPISHVWNKLPRIVRDLARDTGKTIALTMRGADTELDRQVLELIKDPLTHMVRNAADHGLEAPADRRAAGKPETGHITLNACHEGGHILIEIADDGRGLAVDRIRAKALANGLATEAELAAMTEAQIQRFIFRPGFSTAAAVTPVSGRGVGMDVVKTNIERIGGSIALKSVAGQGSTFTITIPLTLAIVSALIVESGGERFAIPQISVVELVRAHRGSGDGQGTGSTIERINGTPVLRLRDRLLPLVNLNDLLRLAAAGQEEDAAHVVVAQIGAGLLGIVVDRVFDIEEVVVKPVAPILRHITMFSGNTILGDGSVIMILDTNGIARATGIGTSGETRSAGDGTGFDMLRSSDKTALLLFRAGGEAPLAVPLALVARLEDISRQKIEMSCGQPVTQYRGKLMPLVALGTDDRARSHQPVLVFADGERAMGLMVDEIVDVVTDRLSIELSGARPGWLGTAVIAGRSTDLIDTGYWLTRAWQDWFHGSPNAGGTTPRPRLLAVEDSDFFRQLLVPTLSAAGYQVTAVRSAGDALRLRDAGAMFDAIISDIEMPEMDGRAFARTVRAGGIWAGLPLIALSARADPADVEVGRAAGFTAYIAKFDRAALLTCLEQRLRATASA